MDSIKITQDILLRVAEIDEFKGLWNGLDRHTTGLNLLGDVADFGANFKRVLGPLREQDLTPEMIRVLHGAQTAEKGKPQGASAFRTGDSDDNFETAAPEDIAPLMKKLIAWLNGAMKKRDMHPLMVIAVFTAVFLQIAPFAKDNMKVARMLATLLMLKAGYGYAPYMPLDKIMVKKSDNILRALRMNQESLAAGRPEWGGWLLCFLSVLQEQKETLQDRLNAKEKDLSRLPTLSAKIMNLFEDHQRLQMKQIVKLTNGRRSTMKLRLGELVETGYLKRNGSARSTWYSLS